MLEWQAGLIVLYDIGPHPDGAGIWQHYKRDIYKAIQERGLFQFHGSTPWQSLGKLMREREAADYIESYEATYGRKNGLYRVRNYANAAAYLKGRDWLWRHTSEAKAAEARPVQQSPARQPPVQQQPPESVPASHNATTKDVKPRSAAKGERKKPRKKPPQLLIPEEIIDPDSFMEGQCKRVSLNAHERNKDARKVCLRHYGYTCKVCKFDFVSMYGDIGRNYINVHHLKPLSKKGGRKHNINPITDLCPICPNCHAMIHRKEGDKPYTVKELKDIIRKAKKRKSDGTT